MEPSVFPQRSFCYSFSTTLHWAFCKGGQEGKITYYYLGHQTSKNHKTHCRGLHIFQRFYILSWLQIFELSLDFLYWIEGRHLFLFVCLMRRRVFMHICMIRVWAIEDFYLFPYKIHLSLTFSRLHFLVFLTFERGHVPSEVYKFFMICIKVYSLSFTSFQSSCNCLEMPMIVMTLEV